MSEAAVPSLMYDWMEYTSRPPYYSVDENGIESNHLVQSFQGYMNKYDGVVVYDSWSQPVPTIFVNSTKLYRKIETIQALPPWKTCFVESKIIEECVLTRFSGLAVFENKHFQDHDSLSKLQFEHSGIFDISFDVDGTAIFDSIMVTLSWIQYGALQIIFKLCDFHIWQCYLRRLTPLR